MVDSKVTVRFEMEKDTKNTIRFKEIVSDPLATAVIGTVYIPKQTLRELGYEVGGQLTVTLSI